jgi:catechol 2,3-dioxygenase-like lactoylglutathione lyase family enzyme
MTIIPGCFHHQPPLRRVTLSQKPLPPLVICVRRDTSAPAAFDAQITQIGNRHGWCCRRGRRLADMTILRMDNVGIVVDDLDAAVAFFTELGMELEGKAQIEGLVADRTVGLDGVRSDIAMMRTPDGHGKLELTTYRAPAPVSAGRENPPPNTLGLHRVMFAVDDIHDTVARLRAHGAELLGEVAQYESSFLLCYLRGPAGIIVGLAEQIG